MSDGKVNIHGKEYKTVALRVAEFRDSYKDHRLVTDIYSIDEEKVIVKAAVLDPNGNVVSVGHAEEFRRSSKINSTSALENAETSAIGRALAFLHGSLAGSEIASADEVAGAISQQGEVEVINQWVEYMNCVRDNWATIEAVQAGIACGDLSTAKEAWQELVMEDEGAAKLLWRAPSKGGIFTTAERTAMKSNEWSAA